MREHHISSAPAPIEAAPEPRTSAPGATHLTRRKRLALVALLASAAALTACGGGGGDSGSPAPAPAPTPVPTPPPPPPPPPPPGVSLGAATDLNGQEVGTTFWPSGDTASGGQGQAIDGLTCGADNETYHVHAHLSIFVDGQQLAIPDHIGIVPQSTTQVACNYSLHTHDSSGKLHVEAPAAATFTLGQFFDIWGQPLSTTNVAGVTGKPVTVYVHEDQQQPTEFTGDIRSIELTSHREITIVVGTPITTVPNFTWSGT
jgi:hypothetical protein